MRRTEARELARSCHDAKLRRQPTSFCSAQLGLSRAGGAGSGVNAFCANFVLDGKETNGFIVFTVSYYQ